jgi:hypothetical protein
MATKETHARLRIADALVVIALAAASLFMIWRMGTEAWFGIIRSLMPLMLLLFGATILYGKNRAGRLVLTRRKWKYFTLLGVVAGLIIVIAVTTVISTDRPGDNPALALFPAIIGLFVAQLYETESSAQFRASDLSDRDAKAWKRIAVVQAIVGIVLGCISGIAGMAGDIDALVLLLPIAILFMVFAAAVWTMLTMRNRQLKTKP